MTLSYVLGVDAGNTKTIALVAGHNGAILGAGRGGCGDIYDTTRVYGDRSPAAVAAAALGSVEDAVRAALSAAAVEPAEVGAGAFNMAGADWPEDYDFLRAAMERRGFGRRIVVVHDSLGALRGGAPDGIGTAVVCGTGAAIGARGRDGRAWHTSFWQESQGGHELGKKTLRAVYRAELELDPPTTLTRRVLDTYGQRSVEDVLRLFTAREGAHPRDVARLALVLLDEAGRGDATARRIVREHGQGLGDYAAVAARRVGLEGTPFTLVLAGGVLREPSSLLMEAIVARVQTTSPEARPVQSRFEPAVGALLLALEEEGVAIDEPLLETLTATLPSPALFETHLYEESGR